MKKIKSIVKKILLGIGALIGILIAVNAGKKKKVKKIKSDIKKNEKETKEIRSKKKEIKSKKEDIKAEIKSNKGKISDIRDDMPFVNGKSADEASEALKRRLNKKK